MLFAGALVAAVSCEQQNFDAPAGDGGWLTGDAQQKFGTLADQFGGFSQTMVEVAYRYSELYWSGEDENWDFAAYQIEHIEEAMEAGFQRRPERKASAEFFMNAGLPDVTGAVEQRDKAAFREAFQRLTDHCNACHAMEDVPFITVGIPTERLRPWGAP